MDFMTDIAASAMSMKNMALGVAYSTAIAKKAMDNTELAAQEMLEMLPQTPPPTGYTLDVYA